MLTFGIEIDFRDSHVAAPAVDVASAEPIRAMKADSFKFMIRSPGESEDSPLRTPLRAIEAMHAAECAEFRNEQIAVRVERDAMWREHESLAPPCRRKLVGADALLGVRADSSHDGARLVEHRHTAGELADDRVVAVDEIGRAHV